MTGTAMDEMSWYLKINLLMVGTSYVVVVLSSVSTVVGWVCIF